MGRPKAELTLTGEERAQLMSWAGGLNSSQTLALRSRIIMACAEGLDNKTVAAQLNCAAATVGKWRRRFVTDRLHGLMDEARIGRPPTITVAQIEDVVFTTLESKPHQAKHWTRASMAERTTLSRTTIARIWTAFGLSPHRAPTRPRADDHTVALPVHDALGRDLD